MTGEQRRDRIVAFIADYLALCGYYPTVREIAKGIGLSSSETTHNYLTDLVREGRLRKLYFTRTRFVWALPEGK